MIEHINVIDTLASQIAALLDLMSMCGSSTDMESINVSADMCSTMLDELMAEVGKIEDKYAMISTSASEG